MSSRFVISPSYPQFTDFLRDIETRVAKNREGKVLCRGRNELRVLVVSNTPLVVKRYKRLNFVKSMLYTLFFKTKARRAYAFARRLEDRGCGTPSPVGYHEVTNKLRFITDTHYVSRFTDKQAVKPFFESEPTANKLFEESLGQFLAQFHEAGFLHNDLNAGNILYAQDAQGNYSFELLDLNRMQMRKAGRTPSRRQCYKDLARLDTLSPRWKAVAEAYLKARNFNVGKELPKMIKAKEAFHKHWERKQSVKQFFRRLLGRKKRA